MDTATDFTPLLSSDDPSEVYSALIRIGKSDRRDLESVVAGYLSHGNPLLKSAAFRVLAFYWELPAFREQALKLAESDCAPELRSVALMALASYENGTRSPAILQKLLDIVSDPDPEVDSRVRGGAYDALLAVAGIDEPNRARGGSGEKLDRIDWKWLEHLLDGTGVHVPVRTVSTVARLGIDTVTYEKLELDQATASYGSLILNFNGETGLVRLIHEAENNRREWLAVMPERTWSHLVSTLEACAFPLRPPQTAESPKAHALRTISWERNGVTESVDVGGSTTHYGDVDKIALRVISQMAPELTADVPDVEASPDTLIELPFIVKPSLG